MKKRYLISLVLLFSISSAQAQTVTSLSFGLVHEVFNESGAGLVDGTIYALPAGSAHVISWQLITAGSPSAITVRLMGSLDGIGFNTIDTNTATGGSVRSTGQSALRFIRIRQDSRTGGTLTRVLFSVGRTDSSLTGMSGTLAGALLVPNGTAGAPSISFASDPDTGFYRTTADAVDVTAGGTQIAQFNAGSTTGLYLEQSIPLRWSSDLRLYRDAAGTLGQRSTTNPQTFRIYNTYTDASNYERLSINWIDTSNVAAIISQHGGTGTSRILDVGTQGTAALRFRTNSLVRFYVSGDGHIQAGLDNTYDIGSSGVNRPRNIYAAGNGVFGTTTIGGTGSISVTGGGNFTFLGRSRIESPADSNVVLYNNARDNFNLLQFGGTTSAFPALKRSGAVLNARLADDSGDAGFLAGSLFSTGGSIHLTSSGSTGVHIRRGTGSPEGVATAPVGTLYLRTDGGAGSTLYVKETGTGNTGWAAK